MKSTVKERIAEAGFAGDEAPDSGTTIGVAVSAATWRKTQGTLASPIGDAPFGTFPRISVDLDSTLSKTPSPGDGAAPADRDLEIVGVVGA